jgi:hypothetical protein
VTEVCLVAAADADLRADLLSSPTAREALSTYDLRAPYGNTLAVDTLSLGTAVSLLNDLEWYLTRYADDALVREPSVDEAEWLSRGLAAAVRDGDRGAADSGLLKMYGVVDGDLVDPMFLARTERGVPEYDLHDTDETVAVRVTEAEFGE